MRIGPGGFLMPYHHPAELANRVAMLDHLAQGRLNFGVAASGLPSDWAMFNVDGNAGQHREMTREALEIILRLWSDEPEFDHKGKYWHVTRTGTRTGTLKPHTVPFQKPTPPIGVAGVSKGSDTLKLAGERGFWPMSLNLNPAYVGSHWESVELGAARTGRTPKRADWRLVREVFIADTDAEAMRLSAGVRPDAEARGLASRARGLHRRHRRGGDATLGRRHDGPDDAGVLPAAPRVLPVHRVPQAQARRARLRRHARVLRQAQLAGGLAGHGDRAAPRDLRGGRRLRHAVAVLLRLRGQPQGVAPLDGAAGARGHAALQEPAAEVSARRVVVFLCAVMAMGAIPDARCQTPASPPVEGNIYSVTYVEVMPPSATAALAVLKRYREAASREDGNLRSEVAQRIGEPHEFVVLAVWRDRAAFEAHAKGTSSTDMRERIAAIRNAPTDERVHTALSVGRLESKITPGAMYVVTHVDVIPPRKDDGIAAVRQLGDDSRVHEGNLRFEVVQQINRPNHFTVVEIWKDAQATEAHSMAPATRQFRDKLAPATGALYDTRKYKAVD